MGYRDGLHLRSIETGWGQPLQAFMEVTDWKHCLGWQDRLRIPLAHAKQSLQPLLLQCHSSLGWSCHWWEWEKSTPRGNRTSSDMTPRISVLASWNCNKLVIATYHRSSPSSHQSDSYRNLLGESVAHTHFRSNSPTKDIRHTQISQGHSHTRTPHQDQGNYFT